ncbi:MAG: hypothetical protein KF768_08940 [Phycisphaeraceae bacterium]|nr:hypothetical protein [Phycisphaeraceae bacterium]
MLRCASASSPSPTPSTPTHHHHPLRNAEHPGKGSGSPADDRLNRLFGGAPNASGIQPAGQHAEGNRGTDAERACDGRLTLLISWAQWRPTTWVDALPVLLEPLGIASVRASSAREAERLVRSTPIHLAVVDLSLPLDHSAPTEPAAGPRVLELLRRLESPPPTVVVKDRHDTRSETRHMQAALNAQAFAVVDRTAADLELMLKVLHRAMDRFYRGRWPNGGRPPTGSGFRG